MIELDNRSFEGIREYLQRNAIEGIVFWKGGKPWCKIKRRDFGFKWPITQAEIDEQIQQREMIEHFAAEAEEESLRKSRIAGERFFSLEYPDHTEFRLRQEDTENENDIGTGSEGTAKTE